MSEVKHIVEGDSRLCPTSSESDNGKVLKVVEGSARWQTESVGMSHSEFASLDPDNSSLADVILILKGNQNV